MRDNKTLIRDLRLVAAGDLPPYWERDLGLCSNIGSLYELDEEEHLPPIFASWSEYTGDPHYPVPASSDVLHCAHHYPDENGFIVVEDDACLTSAAAWAYWDACDYYIGTYGAARRRLAAHVADMLEREEI